MHTFNPYCVIEARLCAGEQPTLDEVLALLKEDPVAAAVFRAGSWATMLYIMRRVNGAGQQPLDMTATTDSSKPS